MRFGPFLVMPLALVLAGSVARPQDDPAGPILSKAIPLNQDAPGPMRVGQLLFLKGWVLRSPNTSFGGLSSMVANDRGEFLAIGDKGAAFRFRIGPDGVVGRSTIRELPGNDPGRKWLNDSESVAIDPASGAIWVGYENRNRIRRFNPALTRIEGDVRRLPMRLWPANSGPEVMARLADGRFVMLSEDAETPDGARDAMLFSGDPTAPDATFARFRYRSPVVGYKPTDARQLPDGRLLVLHRRLGLTDGLSAMLAIVDTAAIRPGATVSGHEIARLGRPMAIDNMEALAVTREAGRTIVWIASDDNFLVLQRTLLLKFALAG